MPETDPRTARRRRETGGDAPIRAAPGSPAGSRSRGCATWRWSPRSSSIAIVGQIVNPVFLQPDNLINVLQTMSEIGLLVLAETLVLIVGQDGPVAGVDLRPRARRRGLADRRRPAPAHGLGLLPGDAGRSRSPCWSARSSAWSTGC